MSYRVTLTCNTYTHETEAPTAQEALAMFEALERNPEKMSMVDVYERIMHGVSEKPAPPPAPPAPPIDGVTAKAPESK